mmetsp:Transcript_85670/g.207561  ORF Transcript_85670/g.207561 Transcript_85670/m.207561 type:complete len:285 (+) Transcript_85670:242-1096(+)
MNWLLAVRAPASPGKCSSECRVCGVPAACASCMTALRYGNSAACTRAKAAKCCSVSASESTCHDLVGRLPGCDRKMTSEKADSSIQRISSSFVRRYLSSPPTSSSIVYPPMSVLASDMPLRPHESMPVNADANPSSLSHVTSWSPIQNSRAPSAGDWDQAERAKGTVTSVVPAASMPCLLHALHSCGYALCTCAAEPLASRASNGTYSPKSAIHPPTPGLSGADPRPALHGVPSGEAPCSSMLHRMTSANQVAAAAFVRSTLAKVKDAEPLSWMYGSPLLFLMR